MVDAVTDVATGAANRPPTPSVVLIVTRSTEIAGFGVIALQQVGGDEFPLAQIAVEVVR